MVSIWKYEIEPDFVIQEVEMPIGAQIISFGLDANNAICFWAKVDTEARKEMHLVACVGTGWPIDNIRDNAKFIGTVVHGPYVWHLFDVGAAQGICGANEPSQCRTEEASAHE